MDQCLEFLNFYSFVSCIRSSHCYRMGSVVSPLEVESAVASPTAVFLYLLVPALLLWYAYHRLSNKHLYDLGNKLPGPPALPIFGNALEFVGLNNHRK